MIPPASITSTVGQPDTFQAEEIGPRDPSFPFQNDGQVIFSCATARLASGRIPSPLTPIRVKGLPFIRSVKARSTGTNCIQGPHQDAQKFKTVILPRLSLNLNFLPSMLSAAISGATLPSEK